MHCILYACLNPHCTHGVKSLVALMEIYNLSFTRRTPTFSNHRRIVIILNSSFIKQLHEYLHAQYTVYTKPSTHQISICIVNPIFREAHFFFAIGMNPGRCSWSKEVQHQQHHQYNQSNDADTCCKMRRIHFCLGTQLHSTKLVRMYVPYMFTQLDCWSWSRIFVISHLHFQMVWH